MSAKTIYVKRSYVVEEIYTVQADNAEEALDYLEENDGKLVDIVTFATEEYDDSYYVCKEEETR